MLCQERDKLWAFGNLAFSEGRTEYLGEVAGKLRVLVCETRTNKPLLLGLVDEYVALRREGACHSRKR